MKTITANRQSGFTLLELLLVIGVAALLLIGGIATYRLVSDGNKTTEATRLLLTLRQETQTMAQQQGGNYTGIAYVSSSTDTTTPLVVSGTLRAGQRNPFNGNIKIDPATGTVAEDNVTVEFDGISQAGCTKLVTAINSPNDVVSVKVEGADVGPTVPYTAAQASAACGATAGVKDMIWQFP
jgi:prepilin-type N-terminal cleavage/methylation domain-containing protein